MYRTLFQTADTYFVLLPRRSNGRNSGAMRALAVVGILSPGLMDGKRRKKLLRCEDLSALYRQSGDDPKQVLEWHKTLAGGFAC